MSDDDAKSQPGESTVIIAAGAEPWFGIVFDLVAIRFVKSKSGANFFLADVVHKAGAVKIRFNIQMLIDDWELREGGLTTVYVADDYKDDEPGADELEKLKIFGGELRLRNLGASTLAFAQLIAAVDESVPVPLPMIAAKEPATAHCECVAFGRDPINIETESFTGKLFFGSENDANHEAQLFFSIDVPARRAWFSEKDPEYRNALKHWFAGHYKL